MNGGKKLILLIDDDSICNSINTLFFKKKFPRKDFPELEIKAFTNPGEGLKFISESLLTPERDDILLLLDINMPEMTGWDFLGEYSKLQKKEKDVKIYILTSSVNQRDITKAEMNADVTGFVSKPLTADVVKNLFDIMDKNKKKLV